MKVLFIGGTGIISSACAEVALGRGLDLYMLNRGHSSARPVPEGATVLKGDIRDPDSARNALGSLKFSAVVNFVAFTPEHIETDLALFRGRTDQYVFISSASAYQKPPAALPVLESTPLKNPFWGYSRDKIACEERLVRAYRDDDFPVTIVRPSHTYDRTLLPMDGGYTVVDRMRRGKPVVVHGDGTSLWVLTHGRDFARAFAPLLGNPHALGESFHITSDEVLSWNAIFGTVARAAGAEAELVHVPSATIAAYDKGWGAGLLGDKSHSMVFDNAKIKRAVPGWAAEIPFARGADEIMRWYDADPSRRQVDPDLDRLMDTLVAAQRSARP